MEKAVLLVENSGAHLRCLLNPEDLTFQRSAGVSARPSLDGSNVAGKGLSDDPLLYRGGGRTEFTLNLLFDTSLVPSSQGTSPIADVRDLTQPLWDLAENATSDNQYGRPPTVSFLWGTHWNLRAVVTAASERLEHFTREGHPRRSWLRLQLLRLERPEPREPEDPEAPPLTPQEAGHRLAQAEVTRREPLAGERLDQMAATLLGHPGYWPLLAALNNIADPLAASDTPLQAPSDPGLLGGAQ
jgi:hypothetical protein